MGHYDDAYEGTMERIRKQIAAEVQSLHEHMPMKNPTHQGHLEDAIQFLLEAYGGHTNNHRERIEAKVHLGRVRGELK